MTEATKWFGPGLTSGAATARQCANGLFTSPAATSRPSRRRHKPRYSRDRADAPRRWKLNNSQAPLRHLHMVNHEMAGSAWGPGRDGRTRGRFADRDRGDPPADADWMPQERDPYVALGGCGSLGGGTEILRFQDRPARGRPFVMGGEAAGRAAVHCRKRLSLSRTQKGPTHAHHRRCLTERRSGRGRNSTTSVFSPGPRRHRLCADRTDGRLLRPAGRKTWLNSQTVGTGGRMVPDSRGRSGRWITSGFGTGSRMLMS